MKKSIIYGLLFIVGIVAITGCSMDNIASISDEDHQHDEELHDYSVEIEGKDMKLLTVKQVAYLWEIDPPRLLDEVTKEFELEGNYTVETTLEEMKLEYSFSPAMVKEIAEDIKQEKI